MSAWSLKEAQEYLKEALEARSRILKAQEYGIGDKRTKRAELEQINEDIRFWKREVERLQRGGIKIGYGVNIG